MNLILSLSKDEAASMPAVAITQIRPTGSDGRLLHKLFRVTMDSRSPMARSQSGLSRNKVD
jgi:hypothetical protein